MQLQREAMVMASTGHPLEQKTTNHKNFNPQLYINQEIQILKMQTKPTNRRRLLATIPPILAHIEAAPTPEFLTTVGKLSAEKM